MEKESSRTARIKANVRILDLIFNIPVAPSESELDKLKKQRHAADFDNTWMKNRPWHAYVRGSGPNSGMFCTFCQKYDKRPFGREAWNKVGCKIIRLVGPSAHRHEPTTKIGLATTLFLHLVQCSLFDTKSRRFINVTFSYEVSMAINT